MRKFILLVTIVATTLSCNNNGKKENIKILPDSAGPVNKIAIVINNELWENSVGDTVRSIMAQSIDGLPQPEPMFSLNQIPTQVFTGFAKQNRSILKIEQGKADFKIERDVHARPQKIVTISGKDIAEIKEQIINKADNIVEALKEEEIRYKQSQMSKSLSNTTDVQESLGIKVKFPSYYRVAKTTATPEDKFNWIKRDLPTGYTNVLFYELPLSAIKKNDSLVSQIIKTRDSIGKKYIAGPVDGSYMATEMAYAPHVYETIIDNKPTIEVKGLWDVKKQFMSGPFLMYLIEDKVNNRYLVAEGFVYAPSVSKRNYVFELESIIRSIKIN
ncbi:DUF4837 family protein [Lacinutrix venerupis]|uniref:DUF4837 domain-containing protein n=1 Tax=Lacinutrix venerupis TaxID=1486034 RepID=A0AAC9LL92_9FLAO|nr:DUF4837 family protein [Lacinutrix venerupis]APX98917.1 DUF4837 domain-containing protein [Lacinutrix venerupis]